MKRRISPTARKKRSHGNQGREPQEMWRANRAMQLFHMCFLPGFRINHRACSIGRFTTCRCPNFVCGIIPYVTRTSRSWREASSQQPQYFSAVLQCCTCTLNETKPPARGGAQRRAARFRMGNGSSVCTGCDGFHFRRRGSWTIDIPRLWDALHRARAHFPPCHCGAYGHSVHPIRYNLNQWLAW